MAAIYDYDYGYTYTRADASGPTYSTSISCRNKPTVYTEYEGNYASDQRKVPEEIPAKQHPFCRWLNLLLYPLEALVILPPEKPPPKKPKIILYFNVKLARAPPLAFFFV